ncbi:MAG TPA: alpha-amylase family glycosyl hydrolase [Bacteroidota bacterium]|nr:alpha-amylase family glycosyl hydrolase [Bacteroidota bacterium]
MTPLQISFKNFPSTAPAILPAPCFEFHIRADARAKYSVPTSLFSSNGNVIFPDFYAVRVFAQNMNDVRGAAGRPELFVRTGHLNAMGLIDEINHYLMRLYEETENPGVFSRAYAHLASEIQPDVLDRTLKEFLTLCPPTSVYANTETVDAYYERTTEGRSHKEIAVEELMLMYFANFNPAFKPFHELFDDTSLKTDTGYPAFIRSLERFFQKEKRFGPDNHFIFDLLKAPILAHPDSLEGQLLFYKTKWGMRLAKLLDKIAGTTQMMDEEGRYLWNQSHRGGKPGVDTFVPDYDELRRRLRSGEYTQAEYERFTSDIEWMPNVVILAKNTYVWLSQLSKKYGRSITRLDHIPDEELDQIARWNFTGLWLIGVWERSHASQRIKQYTGNPEAVPSAYSLYDYEIAQALGGEEAFQNLNVRAWHRGIRLAGDMVPNHMGLYSKWVVEHPDYFIQLQHSPYPNYRFTGGDLSEHPDVELRIEDGYWNRTDAAVVFERRDKRDGSVRYIYHGNDGTNMPWNDTAQLNLLRQDVREAVIQEIFHVARKFSIIRFDAAMTLAKKHFQRLWYPIPGTGGGIPSRSDYPVPNDEFHAMFPNEFWREVVDRINSEMPHTLLLAEAFWLMEGYFVRTLGMHRVYNSAFMHMLMKEENSKYRMLIKNTLEFNPEILKRYVNFMSNPDEETAIAQFGKDDKYFGVALMMATLPGLPMFAHGQIEGFTEKYGMEYQRAYYDEYPDSYLVRRHEHEIFPILRKRHLFSQVTNFQLYDFHDVRGYVNENVFAYTNMSGSERAVIFYHNKYEETSGWIRYSLPKNEAGETAGSTSTKTIGDALSFNGGERMYYIFRDYKSNLEYIRSGREIHDHGIYSHLRAFEYCIFLDFQEVYDATGEYERLAGYLGGRGTPNMQSALKEMKLRTVADAVAVLVTKDYTAAMRRTTLGKEATTEERIALERFCDDAYAAAVQEAALYLGVSSSGTAARANIAEFRKSLRAAAEIVASAAKKKPSRAASKSAGDTQTVSATVSSNDETPAVNTFGGTAMTEDEMNVKSHSQASAEQAEMTPLKKMFVFSDKEHLADAFIVSSFVLLLDDWNKITARQSEPARSESVWVTFDAERIFTQAIEKRTKNRTEAEEDALLVRLIARFALRFWNDKTGLLLPMQEIFDDYAAADFLQVHQYLDQWYFNKERFEMFLDWMFTVTMLRLAQAGTLTGEALDTCRTRIREAQIQAQAAGYQVEKLKEYREE